MRPWTPRAEWPRTYSTERGYAVVLWFYALRGFPDEDAPGMKEALKEAALERSAEIARRAARICEERKVD